MIAKQFDEDTMILMVDKREHELLEWALSARADWWHQEASDYSHRDRNIDFMNAKLQAEEYEDLAGEVPEWDSYV